MIYFSDCKDSHDIPNYLLKKEVDISSECYMFEQYGKCPQGLTCRFGGIHINKETNTNIIKDDAVFILYFIILYIIERIC